MIKKNSGGEAEPALCGTSGFLRQACRISMPEASGEIRRSGCIGALDRRFQMDEKVASCIELIRGLGQAIISATNDKIQNYVEECG